MAFGVAGGGGWGLFAGGIAGGAAGGATGGGLSAAFYGGDVGDAMLKGAGYGAIAGGVTAGLIYAGVPGAIASAGGGYASGYTDCGAACGRAGAWAGFGGAVLSNALTIAGVGAEGTVPAEGSSEWNAMNARNDTYVTTPDVSFKGFDALWMLTALLGNGYSHTWHTQDITNVPGQTHPGYVPSGHYYKFVQSNVPYPANAQAYLAKQNFGLFTNNCTTRLGLGFIHPAHYSSYYNYPGQGAYWWGW